jgi:hypothetical protein
MQPSVRLLLSVVLSFALLLLLSTTASARVDDDNLAFASTGGNNPNSTNSSSSSSSGGGSGLPSPYGCPVSAPSSPFVLVRNVSLDRSTQSIAIFNSTLYYAETYDSFTGFVYALDLNTLTLLTPINISAGASAFPAMSYPPAAMQLRLDNTGRLHLVDFRNSVIICIKAGVWQSVIPAGWGGIWSFDISPDGETYYVNGFSGQIAAFQRSTGTPLPFKHAPTASSVVYGPDGTIYVANGNFFTPPSIDIISTNGTVLSSIDLSAFTSLRLDISAMVVDANNTIIFTNRQGSGCNDLCFYFQASGNMTCWPAVAGYDFGLSYDADTAQVTCLRGYDDHAIFTFANPVEAAMEQQTASPVLFAAPLGSDSAAWTVSVALISGLAVLAVAAVLLAGALLLRQKRQKAAAAPGAASLLSTIAV